MEESLSGIFNFFLMLLVALIIFWYVTLPVLVGAIVWYNLSKNRIIRKLLRVFFVLIGLAIFSGILLILFN